MNVFESTKPWYKQKTVLGAGALGIIVIVGVFFLLRGNGVEEEVVVQTNPMVTLTTANQYLGGESISLVGNVRAFTEAAITTERAGRVVRVNVTLGQAVSAGQVLATLENAAESASVLQAEGAYDAAVAAKAQGQVSDAQSGVSVEEAQIAKRNVENTAVSNFKSTFNTVNGVVLNDIDAFFSAPRASVPGLRIDGRGNTSFLNAERVAYQTLLPQWQARVDTISVNSNLDSELAYAEQNLLRTIALVDTFITIFSEQDSSTRYTDAELQNFRASFISLRSNLSGVQSSLNTSVTGLNAADDAIERAQLSTSVTSSPAADAQIKQALGSLRAAQANFAKTVLRTPISGTVNSIDIRTGDFVGSFEQVAEVANNNALEIVVYVSDNEIDLIAVGDTLTIEGEFEGTITQIAPAVESATRKTEVRIAAEDIDVKNGDTVTVTKEIAAARTTTVIVPLTAVKFEIEDGFIFTVENNKLVQKPVKLGVVRGSSVEILEGLSAADPFVVDSRGLLPGNEVTISE